MSSVFDELTDAALAAANQNLPIEAPHPDKRFIEFKTTDRPVRAVRVHPGDGPPVSTDGRAIIESVARPHLRGLTRHRGWNPLAMDIPILLDAYRQGGSVEDDIDQLERMAGRGGQPHTVELDATGNLLPIDGKVWYITDISYGDQLLNRHGERMRVSAVVTVLQHVAAETEKSIAKRTRVAANHASSYRVRKGDTLRSISRKVYGNADRWDDIRRANNIGDPRIVGTVGNKKGQVGTILRMPQ